MPLPDLQSLLLTLTSLVTLLLGTRLLVGAALRLPNSRHTSAQTLSIALIVLSCGLPKLVISLLAIADNSPDIAVGTVLGSNLFNLLAVLGSIAILIPLQVVRPLLYKDLPVLLGAALLSYALVLDQNLSLWDGSILLLCAAAYGFWLWRRPRPNRHTAPHQPVARSHWFVLRSLARLSVGAALLGLGAFGLIEGCLKIAQHLGLSERVTGLTLVAACACIPEWLCVLNAAMRKRFGFAVAIVLGSNVFSLLMILGLSAWLANGQLSISPNSLDSDWLLLLGATALCLPVFYSAGRISRLEGLLMLLGYLSYVAYLLLFSLGRPEANKIEHLGLHYALPIAIGLSCAYALYCFWRSRTTPR